MRGKSWSYKQITESAETSIRHFMALAQKQSDPDLQRFHRTAAYGALVCWEDLTMGWMKDGDRERMNALTQPGEAA